MKQWSHLNTSVQVLQAYNGQEPFAFHLKKFFSANKKYGSSDRRQIGHLCYCYFRLGKSLPDLAIEERILTALYFCSNISNDILEKIRPEWNESIKKSIEEKWKDVKDFSVEELFPWQSALSNGIDFESFCKSFFIQPDLFLRVRPGNDQEVKAKLQEAGVSFTEPKPACIALPNSTNIDKIIELNREAVIQDYNSQFVGEFLTNLKSEISNFKLSAWDCCAASGGKSILVRDILPKTELTVSDIRESILVNLKERFKEAGIKNYRSFVADLTRSARDIPHEAFDLIIADVPCTGSGTWSRTPEQLFYFKKEKIAEYTTKQRSILSNVLPALKKNGHLLYITCSVFKEENEEMIEFIQQQYKLQLIRIELLKGYDKKADTLFAALLRNQKKIELQRH